MSLASTDKWAHVGQHHVGRLASTSVPRWVVAVSCFLILSAVIGICVAAVPEHVPRALILEAMLAALLGIVSIVLRDLIRPLVVATILASTLQNVPLLFAGSSARAGGAPDGLLILPADVLVASLAGVLLIRSATRRHEARHRPNLPPGFIFGLGFIGWGVISAFWSPQPSLSIFEALRDLIAFASWAIVAILLSQDIGLIRAICAGFGIVTLGESAIALAEWFNGSTLGLTYLGVTQVEQDLTNQSLLRVGGTLGHPNFLGGYLAMSIPMATLGLIVFRYRWQRVIAGFAIVAGIAAVIVSASRGAYLAIAVEGAIAFVVTVRAGIVRLNIRTILLGSAALVTAVVLYGVFASFITYRLTENDPTSQFRWILNGTALSIFAGQPLTGIGLNNFAEFLNVHMDYATGTLPTGTPVHNFVLLLLAETGLIGLAMFGAWLAIPIARASRALPSLPATNRPIFSASVIALVGASVIAMVDWSLRSPALQLTSCVVLGCVAGLSLSARPESAEWT